MFYSYDLYVNIIPIEKENKPFNAIKNALQSKADTSKNLYKTNITSKIISK